MSRGRKTYTFLSFHLSLIFPQYISSQKLEWDQNKEWKKYSFLAMEGFPSS